MNFINLIKQRRSYYNINKQLPVSNDTVIELVKEIVENTPDAFNMKSARVIVVFNNQHDKLWDTIYQSFDGKVAKEKIDSFKNGAGTVLFFYDKSVVESLQKQFALYADNFPIWAMQANGMLQSNIWVALKENNIGASLQHFNPIIDKNINQMFNVDKNWVLVAQMPFGGIGSEPNQKEKEDINKRVVIFK